MMTNIKIRIFEPEDRPTLVQFMEALQEIEYSLHANRTVGAEIADAHLEYLEKIVQTQNGKIYVAQRPEQIIGFIVCFVEKLDLGDLHVIESEREYGYISDLYISPTMRKQGVGVELMKAAETHFSNLELKVIRVGLLSSNTSAEIFYQQVGYQAYEVVYEKYI